MDYTDQTAIVTGAGSGLGRSLALAMAQRGADLALFDVSQPGLEETARQVAEIADRRVTLHRSDVSDAAGFGAALDDALAQHPVVGVVCANAGVGFAGTTFSNLTEADLAWVLGVNTLGAVRTIQHTLPALHRRGSGRILITSSIAALDATPGWDIGLYSASKAGIVALAQSVRDELGDAEITVSIVYPGLMQTNIGANAATLRPGGTQGTPVAGLDTSAGITADAAAEISIRGMEQGLHDIFTHPAEVAGILHEREKRLRENLTASSAIVDDVLG